jgi:molybdate transport system ATP-binding protein
VSLAPRRTRNAGAHPRARPRRGDRRRRTGRLSIRNRLKATVTEIAEADGQAVDVRLDAGGETLIASVTREAVRALDLKVGQPVVALIKATAMDRLDEAE